MCFASSADSDIPGSCDVFHSDEETGSQTAHPSGTDGTEGWRITWRTEPEPETGEPQVHTHRKTNIKKCDNLKYVSTIFLLFVLQAFQR